LLAGSKKVFCYYISKWRLVNGRASRMAGCQKTFRNHNNLNCDRIFRAKRQLSLIPLNRTAALPAALSNLTRLRLTSLYSSELYKIADVCHHHGTDVVHSVIDLEGCIILLRTSVHQCCYKIRYYSTSSSRYPFRHRAAGMIRSLDI